MKERKEIKYPIADVFAFVSEHADSSDKKKKVEFDGDAIKPNSLRYKTFMKSGTKCVCCGLEATHFYKERSQSSKPKNYDPDMSYHFNLYGINECGEEVLFTKDHIIPKVDGGRDAVDNMQTMCTVCNGLKSDMPEEKFNKITGIALAEGSNFSKLSSEEKKKFVKEYFNREENRPTYEETLERANKYGKKVFVVTSLDNRFCIASSIKTAKKKFANQTIVPYDEWEGKDNGN